MMNNNEPLPDNPLTNGQNAKTPANVFPVSEPQSANPFPNTNSSKDVGATANQPVSNPFTPQNTASPITQPGVNPQPTVNPQSTINPQPAVKPQNAANSFSAFPNASSETQSPIFAPPGQINQPKNQPLKPANVKKTSGSSKFLIIMGIITLIVVGGVVYLYLSNQKLKKNQTEITENTQSTPIPTVKKATIKILNGNIVSESESNSEPTILINKTEYKDKTGITGFAKVSTSPDSGKMCFESYSPAPAPALYVANSDGTQVKKVDDLAVNCLWTKDSAKIVYLNSSTNILPADIHIYDISSAVSTNLTTGLAPSGVIRNYELVSLSEDGQSINCLYTDSNLSNTEGQKQNCTIPITSR